jgi:hypothetical protein
MPTGPVPDWPRARPGMNVETNLGMKINRRTILSGTATGAATMAVGGRQAIGTDACREFGRGTLVPTGAVNPILPDWDADLRRCREELQMPDVILSPLPGLVRWTEGALVQNLNLRPRGAALKPGAEVTGISFDSARAKYGTDWCPWGYPRNYSSVSRQSSSPLPKRSGNTRRRCRDSYT